MGESEKNSGGHFSTKLKCMSGLREQRTDCMQRQGGLQDSTNNSIVQVRIWGCSCHLSVGIK